MTSPPEVWLRGPTDAIGLAIEGVSSASFLTPEQKRDIFYANGLTFFRFRREGSQ